MFHQGLDVVFNETFQFSTEKEPGGITLLVYDHDRTSEDDILGLCRFNFQDIREDTETEKVLSIFGGAEQGNVTVKVTVGKKTSCFLGAVCSVKNLDHAYRIQNGVRKVQ